MSSLIKDVKLRDPVKVVKLDERDRRVQRNTTAARSSSDLRDPVEAKLVAHVGRIMRMLERQNAVLESRIAQLEAALRVRNDQARP